MFQEISFQNPTTTRRNSSSYSHSATASSYPRSSNPQTVSSADFSHLAHQFSQHSIRHDPRNTSSTYANYTTTPYTNDYVESSPQNRYECPHALTNVRSKRQANTRLQCQPSYARELSSLVERMIASGEGCLVCSPSLEDFSDPSTDEGLGDMDDFDYLQSDLTTGSSQTLSYRRSSDFSQNYVPKSIRVRKAKRQKKRYE